MLDKRGRGATEAILWNDSDKAATHTMDIVCNLTVSQVLMPTQPSNIDVYLGRIGSGYVWSRRD